VNPKLLELALRKQRLQMRAESQRAELLVGVEAVEGVLARVDRLRDGISWLRHHAPAVSILVLVLLALRPRFTLRWLRRGWLGWQVFRRLRGGVETVLAQATHALRT
jgi:hypothetical protein